MFYADGTIRRTFTHVQDNCNIIIRATEKDESKNEIYNIGGLNLSLLDAAEQIANKYGVRVEFSPLPEMALKLESDDTIFDDSKIQSILKYDHQHDLGSWLMNF